MDILQANQEIQRLREMFAAGQITPDSFTQAVNQLQIVDAAGSFWHVDGASLRWYHYEGQTWVERTPPVPPPYPAPGYRPAQTQPIPAQRPAANSGLSQWITLGVIGLVVVVTLVIFGPRLLAPVPSPTSTSVAAVPTTQPQDKPTPTPTQETAVPTQKPTLPAATPTAPAATPTLEATLPSTAPSAADILSLKGPWLLSKDNDNVYWILPEGSITLNADKVVSPFAVEDMLSPSGGYVAFITSGAPDGMHHLKLNIYSLSTKAMLAEIALTSPQTEPGPDIGPGDPPFEALRSITDFTSLAWSPDGRQLAFTGFMDGPSSDLYLYTLKSDEVTRLTDEPSQTFEPSWSPDGKYIVQFGATAFGTGAGFSMSGAWATRPDSGASIELYTPHSSEEVGLGWAGANTFLVYSFSPACDNFNLRAVDIEPLKVRTVFGGCFNAIDFAPSSVSVILGIVQDTADNCVCGDKIDSGLYLVKLDGSYQRLDPANFFQASWIKGASVAWGMSDKGVVAAFNQAGEAVALPAGVPVGFPLAAPGGKVWAWPVDTIGVVPGLWVGPPGGAAPMVSKLPVSSAVWNESGTTLVFLSGDTLYAAVAPQYAPVALLQVSSPGRLAWVAP